MVTITNAFQSYLEDEILLLMFKFDKESSTYRGLKDGGCQWNSITNTLTKDLNLEVKIIIEDIQDKIAQHQCNI